MDVPQPNAPDTNRGTSVFIGTWVLTAVVGLVLCFRFSVKAWIRWVATVSSPQRLWGFEDLFFALGFASDVAHMTFIWLSYEHGLGRHFFYLEPMQRQLAMKYNFISQPLAVTAAMLSRTGVVVFLYACFAKQRKTLQIVILTLLVTQIVINMITILQIILQCGPSPYRVVDRASYFRYMWEPHSSDVVCQSPKVQTMIGYIQGGFNTVIDFMLAFLSGFEIWQFMFLGFQWRSVRSLRREFLKLDSRVRNQRLWLTLLLVGPLVLSGVASIVKTYLLSALGSRLDFTWNIVPFVLWVKIEDYCIPIAATVPIVRLFIRNVLLSKNDPATHGYSGRGISKTGGHVELTGRTDWTGTMTKGAFVSTRNQELDRDDINDTARAASSHGSENDLVERGGILVKSEFQVHHEDIRDEHMLSADSRRRSDSIQ